MSPGNEYALNVSSAKSVELLVSELRGLHKRIIVSAGKYESI